MLLVVRSLALRCKGLGGGDVNKFSKTVGVEIGLGSGVDGSKKFGVEMSRVG